MHTMGEAAAILGIGRVTLEKWCKRLGIEPERHPQDWRFRTITPSSSSRSPTNAPKCQPSPTHTTCRQRSPEPNPTEQPHCLIDSLSPLPKSHASSL